MNVFIDTNVFLAFFHFAGDDLDELKKLSTLLSDGTLRLLLPAQVVDEFRRNRANKIQDAIKTFRDGKVSVVFPQFCKAYPQYGKLKEMLKTLKAVRTELDQAVHQDIANENLKADQLIRSLFGLAQAIPTTDSLFNAAWRRVQLGNPPGKAGSLGDALNWEALLGAVAPNEDLHFVTDDRDFASPLNDHSMNPFLLSEWRTAKSSSLWFYRSLSAFFKDHYPNIKLAMETEKDTLIQQLGSSPSFAWTHSIVAGLAKHVDFTPEQAAGIVNAAMTNNQVAWICQDPDVKDLVSRVVEAHKSEMDPAVVIHLRTLMGEQVEAEAAAPSDDLPF